MKLRNPWGNKGEWNGDWSDKSDKWTPELKK
jgi:calpain-15